MQPRHGRPGTRVVFTGKDLQSVSAVRFGGALCLLFLCEVSPVGFFLCLSFFLLLGCMGL